MNNSEILNKINDNLEKIVQILTTKSKKKTKSKIKSKKKLKKYKPIENKENK